jgi:flagellar basal body-associated protein FliL
MSIKKKVLIIVIAILATIGTIFAVLMGIYYYMIHTQVQNLRDAMSKHDGPNPKLPSQNVSNG